VRATASFNREDRSSLSIRVRADDGYRHGFSKPLAISVNDVDDPPTALALAGTTVAENQMIGTDVGTLSASDEDGDALSFALVRGPGDDHNSQFQISGSTLETAETLDHRDGPTRSIRVRVDDGRGGSEERALPIEVVAMDPELERLDLRVPGRAEKLIDDGVRAQLRCAVECRVAIELVGRGRIARRAGLEGSIGDGDGKLVGGRKQWLTARLDKRSERRLEAFGGKRSPRIVARFEAKRAD
jgi:hypothetical protein